MKHGLMQKVCSSSVRINRYAYALYMIIALVLFIRQDYEWTMVNLGMALVFDPFDPKVTWPARPFYQRAWLFVHAGLVFVLLAVMLLQRHPH